ncbi:MAG: hypothetical protein ING19_15715 [Azospirillum sp.]|nr:hypothetical protein [Azospirillum sp.]
MPSIEAWLEELDDAGPHPEPAFAAAMLARCPEPDCAQANWLRRLLRD